MFHVKHYELLLLITPIARRIYGLYAFLICIFIYRRKNVAVGRYVVNQVYMSGFMRRKYRFMEYISEFLMDITFVTSDYYVYVSRETIDYFEYIYRIIIISTAIVYTTEIKCNINRIIL